jgi:site-specific recombinase XerD
MGRQISRWKVLRENQLVKRYYENTRAGSPLTANYYVANLGLFLEYINGIEGRLFSTDRDQWIKIMKDAPERLINMASSDPNQYADKYIDFVRKKEKEGKSGLGIAVMMQSVVSFLEFNRVSGKVSVKIGNKNVRPVKENEKVPTNEQLATILRQARTKTGLMISLMAFSGLRPEVIGNFDGTDGLRISDLVDLNIEGDKIEIAKMPLRIRVRTSLSKNNKEYYTFLSKEGCVYLKEYLDERLRQEKLKSNSPLIVPAQSNNKSFLATHYVSRFIKDAIVKSGFNWRPYVLRRYFVTGLALAESKSLITHSWRQFITGHNGDMESVYEDMSAHVDEIREAYDLSTKYLGTISYEVSKDEIDREVVRGMLRYFGNQSEDEINKIMTSEQDQIADKVWESFEKAYQERVMDVYDATSNGEDADEVQRRELQQMYERIESDIKRLKNRKNGGRQVAVPSEYVQAYLEAGFEFIAAIGDKAVMRLLD